MAYKNGKMQPNTSASAGARSKTAGPNGSFPIGDAKHARLAIGAATRSENAGHISESEANHIKSAARKELGISQRGTKKIEPLWRRGLKG